MLTLSDLLGLRPPKRSFRRRAAPRPRAPRASELEYVQGLLRLVQYMRAVAIEEIHVGENRHDALFGRLADSFRMATDRMTAAAGGEKISELTYRVGRSVDSHVRREMQRVLGIPIQDELRAQVDSFRRANVDLVKGFAADTVDDLRRTFDAAQGLRAEEIAKQIGDRFDVAASRATFIAVDQVLKFNGQLSQLRQEHAGVERYEWSTSNDSRVRPSHRRLNGRSFSWNEPPVVSDDGRHEHPGRDFRCRCVAIPVI